MQFMATYNWNGTFNNIDTFFIDESLNWDETFSLLFTDYTPFSFSLLAFFTNSHFFLDSPVKFSSLDALILRERTDYTTVSSLYAFLLQDLLSSMDVYFLLPNHLFYLDYQNFIVLMVYHNPELTIALNEHYTQDYYSLTLEHNPSTLFDVYNDNLNISTSEFLEHFFLFFIFIWLTVLSFFNFRLNTWDKSAEPYLTRAYNYLFSISKEVRLQFDAVVQAFFFVFLYTVTMITTFDDDQEEGLELFNGLCFYFFLLTLIFYFFKYSVHFFTFLEPSKVGGRSIVWIFGQFYTDLFNTISLTMRFLVLMIRLNIYDGVDDVLDSYYIFVADFEEDEYYVDLFFSTFTTMFFDYDNNDDRSFFLEDEIDFTGDLFTLYFVLWGKFFFFLLFVLEILARMTLALYVTYLIIFEINAVNRSYSESDHFSAKRSFFNLSKTFKNSF